MMQRVFKNAKWKWMISGVSAIVVLIVGMEIFLRMHYGLCDAPLYSADPDFEYMLVANQDGMRLGKHYHTNSYRQRNEEPNPAKKKVLGLGDSVLFGGTQSANEETAPYYYDQMTGNQMLNISAGSWGPDNCAAYLRRYGLFDAKAIWLLVNSHDAHDIITHEEVVGVHQSYPKEQYPLAIIELFDRYIIPRYIKQYRNLLDPDEKVIASIDKRSENSGGQFNPGFDEIREMAQAHGIPMYVCLHADKIEAEAGEYDEQGQEIIAWCEKNHIPLIQDIAEGITLEMYRDGIHLNTEGNKFHAKLMAKYCKF